MARTAELTRSTKQKSSRTTSSPPLDVRALLATASLSTTHIQQIVKRYGAHTERVLRTSPYRLMHEIDGISFIAIDMLARKLGRGRLDIHRIRAGIRETLQRGLRSGHTCLPLSRIITRTAKLLQVPPPLVEEHCLRGALDVGGAFILEQRGGETVFTSLAMRRIEDHVAQALVDRLYLPLPPLVPNLDAVVQQVGKKRGLNIEQQQALQSALSAPLTIVTGGPGTGKSYFCQALAEVAAQFNISLLAGAPTGRAAQRLSEVSGLSAATLHRLLEYQPKEGTFLRTSEFPLDTAMLVIDETSMVDLFLFDHMLDALPLGARLVLIGDVDQLPSVGPGQVLSDVIASDIAPTVRFTQLYRRSAKSTITESAHSVRDGHIPQLTNDLQSDFRFIEERDPERAIAQVVDLVTQDIPAALRVDPHSDIQVLAPLNVGPIGTQVLNQALQQRLNPDGSRVRLSPDKEFRVGDRLVITENNYRLNVFNGDSGVLVRANPDKHIAVVDTGREQAMFIGKELSALTLGYATSVHRAQGGEFPVVVVVLHDLHEPLLQRTLLYTAITRAKRLCVVVGTRCAIGQAIRNVRALHRYTGLVGAIHHSRPHYDNALCAVKHTE